MRVLGYFLFFALLTGLTQTKIHVHLIAHTHDDVGWLKTVDEYFYGSGNNILGIQYIIEGIMGELLEDPEKKFSWVEMGYFYRYWAHQDDLVKDSIRDLVKQGRLEFLNGGWVMHDEAITYYEDMIDNMALGQKFIQENFGVFPTIGWQIDPFGHSSTNAALFSEMGLDAFWFSRIDHVDKQRRKRDKNIEFIWQPRTSQGDENQILSILNYDHYDFPDEFCFDYNCIHRQSPIIDDKSVQGYNIEWIAARFATYAKQASDSNYEHDHIIFPMGGDFAYEIASMPFENFDKIKNYINERSNQFDMEITYSLPSDYVNAVYSEKLNLTKNEADFFPYSDKTGSYWTGYYSSRNFLKKLVRQSGKDLQNVRRLLTYTLWQGESFDFGELNLIWGSLNLLERKQAELQHHDAVTGTSQQHVSDDYYHSLDKARVTLHEDVTSLLFERDFNKLLNQPMDVSFKLCETNLVSTSNCDTDALKKNQSIIVGVFNPVEAMSKVVNFKVPNGNLRVLSLSRSEIESEVICINYQNVGCTLYFKDEFEGHSIQYYLLSPNSESIELQAKAFSVNETAIDIKIDDDQILKLTPSLSDYEISVNGEVTKLNVDFNYYTPKNSWEQTSGVYIFLPSERNHTLLPSFASPTNRDVYAGKIITQIVTLWEEKAFTRMSVFDDLSNIQIDTLITDGNSDTGKEIVMLVTTDIQNNQTFYTDSNGMEMQKRTLNKRETWTWEADEPISGNYYPITSSIYLEDVRTQKRATLLVDRAVGGSCLEEGQLEIMLDRRCLGEDKRGMGERLNEAHIAHWHSSTLLITTPNSQKGHYYRYAQYLSDQPNLIFAAPVPQNFEKQAEDGVLAFIDTIKCSKFDLPYNVKLLAWPQSETEFILRFHNMNDDRNSTIDISQALDSNLENIKLIETTVTGNQDKESMRKRKKDWTYSKPGWDYALNKDYVESKNPFLKFQPSNMFSFPKIVQKIFLRPQEIRTFRMIVQDAATTLDESVVQQNNYMTIRRNPKQKKLLDALRA